MTIFQKNLRERPFEAIKEGTKKIEIRANKNSSEPNSFNLMKVGDEIIFTKEGSEERIKCVVKRIEIYPSIKELLLKEGTEHTLSSTNDLEEGIKSIESIPNYKKLISENGVFAIELLDVKQL